MKILLIEADFIRVIGSKKEFFNKPSAPTLGINYLASILRNKGHEVIVLDSLYNYIRTDFSSPIDMIEGTKEILEKERNIECIGISITSPTRIYALNIAKEVKIFNPKIKVIAGGPHITILQEMFLEKFYQYFDFLVVREGDITFPELISSIEGKMPFKEVSGIIYKEKKGKITKTNARPNLTNEQLNNTNIVPFIDYSQYKNILPERIIPAISLVTTRGCPYFCDFCYSPRFWGKYREQTSVRVLAEIKHFVEKYNVKNIRFQDDTFTHNKNRCLKIFEGIIRKKWNIELYMHTRFDCIDEDIIKDYARAGGKCIYFGLESGSRKIRRTKNKNYRISNEKILSICNFVKRIGIKLGLWLIFGLPGETEDDIIKTNDLLHKISPDEVTSNPLHVHPNTPLFKKASKENIYTITDWLTSENDFFPYIKGRKALHIVNNCKIIENKYNSKHIRTHLETEY